MKSYQFDAAIAQLYGVDCAVMIWNLSYWIEHNAANGKHFYDGRHWTYNSVEAFTEIFPFWTRAQVRRILNNLQERGVIMVGNYNENKYDRTAWYAFTDEFQQMHLLKSANGNVESRNSNRDSNNNNFIPTDNNPDNKTSGPAGAAPAQEHPERDKGEGTSRGKVSRARATSEPLCLFADSRYSDPDMFAQQFDFKGTEYEDVDIMFYYNAVADWSSRKAKKQKDWIATARSFMRSDKQEGKLVRLKRGPMLTPEAEAYLNRMM